MHILPSATAALQKLRAAVLHPEHDATPAEPIAGASFLAQEPDLAKEAGVDTREISGWAAGGHPSAE